MFSIQDLLARHRIPGLKQSEDRRVCSEVLENVLGMRIPAKDIQIAEGILTLSVPPVLKSAVAIKQEEVRERLKEKGISVSLIR